MAELGIGGVGQTVEFVPVADMAAVRQRPNAQRAGLFGHRLAVLGLAAGDHHVRAPLGERQHHRPAQTPAAAGDQGDLAGQVEKIGHALLPSMGTVGQFSVVWRRYVLGT